MDKTYSHSRRKVRCNGIQDGRNCHWKSWRLLKAQSEPAPLLNATDAADFVSVTNLGPETDTAAVSRQWIETDRRLFPNLAALCTDVIVHPVAGRQGMGQCLMGERPGFGPIVPQARDDRPSHCNATKCELFIKKNR